RCEEPNSSIRHPLGRVTAWGRSGHRRQTREMSGLFLHAPVTQSIVVFWHAILVRSTGCLKERDAAHLCRRIVVHSGGQEYAAQDWAASAQLYPARHVRTHCLTRAVLGAESPPLLLSRGGLPALQPAPALHDRPLS